MNLNETQLIVQFKFQISDFKNEIIFELMVRHRLYSFVMLIIRGLIFDISWLVFKRCGYSEVLKSD